MGIFRLLTRGNLKVANEVFVAYKNRFFNDEKLRTPLINFTQFLLLTLERDAYPFFQKLTEKYAPSIARDTQFSSVSFFFVFYY